MEDVVVPEEGNAMAADSHPVDRSDQESEFQPPLSPTHVLRSVISSSLSSHAQLPQHASAVSALQSKMKARSERKAIWKQPSKMKEDRRTVPGFYMSACSHTGAWGFSSSDEDMEARAEDLAIHTVEDKSIITSMGHGEAVFLENITDNICNAKQDFSLCRNKPWTPPKGFWRIARQEPLLSNGGDVSEREESKSGLMPRHTALRTDPSVQEEIKRSDSAESHPQSCRPSDSVAKGSDLWRAESLESICSSGSSLSLAEKVEINRTILRQMLQKAQRKSGEGQQATITDQKMENTHSRGGLNDSDWDSGISLHDSEQTQRPFVSGAELPLSPRHEQAKQLLERARMKARSNPLKADHTILPVQRDKPELLSWVGAPVQQAPLVGTERVVVGSGNLSDSSSSDSTGGSRRRRTHGQSPTRVRFQDETEKDAEVRYLERQCKRVGERAQGLLGAKPSLATYINSQRPEDKYKSRRSQEDLPDINSHYEPATMGQQCNSCGTILDGDFSDPRFFQKQPSPANGESEGRTVPCWVAPTLPNRLVRIEQIKETYIGAMSPVIVESDGTHCRATGSVGSGRGTLQKQKRKSRKRDGSPEIRATAANGLRTPGSPSISRNTPMSNGAIALPPNPYALDSLEIKVEGTCKSLSNFKACVPSVASRGEVPGAQSVPGLPQPVSPPLQPKKSALNLDSPSGQRVMPSQHHHLMHIDIVQEGGEQSNLEGIPQGNPDPQQTTLISKNSIMKELAGSNSHGQRTIIPGQHGSQQAGLAQDQIRVEVAASPAKTSVNNGHVQGPIRAEEQREDSSSPSPMTSDLRLIDRNMTPEAEQREGKAQQALRRFFSAMGLNAGRRISKSHSSSMEQLGPPLKPRTNSSETPSHPHTLKKAPSLQNLRLASPFSQLKKSSSVQNLQSPKRKPERSTVYTPGERPCSPALSRGLQRALSVEDVGSPSAMRSVGRVAQAFPDGTFLLELNRPPDRPFGFLISRGKGRPDSGVYVEDMGDSSTQKLYAGLLGVGDEILEVNGEKVAGLSLDLVTQLMVQNGTASIRVLRHRPPHR
ncbi:hypothetical protein PHYPO_G00025500 [Pangasianodon hypophthalmus]|uniref:PDZ domain-containing protein n=1 Tax=Pangasianodon hypophthalmus TaxID=310915 RepID=A0A5N5MVV3_PANHP|nr:hypothetical protein PHYPO_G00025500 [Pangasianodon hypophthalmus]